MQAIVHFCYMLNSKCSMLPNFVHEKEKVITLFGMSLEEVVSSTFCHITAFNDMLKVALIFKVALIS
jgi:hypothetical protein